jgi:hypothetical protein
MVSATSIKKIFFSKEYEVIDLHDSGICNYAFDIISAIEYMYEATSCGKLILGGDIVILNDGVYTESYDSWYSDKRTPDETLSDALKYLRIYLERNHKELNWKICIVIQ